MNFKYDVAFSFLAPDEALALQFNDLLQDRYATFVYSKRQEQLGGTDGEVTFKAVFNQEARFVVVLYRNNWGQTPWTRIEETAIRERAYGEGYEFVKLVPLDEKVTPPKWFPKTQIWIDYKRWGVEATARIIEARLIDMGANPRDETVEQRAARMQRRLDFEDECLRFQRSKHGVDAANDAFRTLKVAIQDVVTKVTSAGSPLQLIAKYSEDNFLLCALGFCITVGWNYRFNNSLDESVLSATISDRRTPFTGIRTGAQPEPLVERSFDFGLVASHDPCWIERGKSGTEHASTDLGPSLVKWFLDEVDKRSRQK